MLNRRELNRSLALMLSSVLVGPAGELLQAATLQSPRVSERAPARKSGGVKTLMEEPLAPIPNAEVSVITLTVPPGSSSPPHRHIGPVFAYVLEGTIENQVDPNPPHTYRPGQFFYEPPMHVHRMLRNLSKTRPATLLIFQVGEKGKKFTISAG